MSEEQEEEVKEVKKHFNVKYSDEKCQFCDSRIDEYGFCACGSAGS